MEGAGLHVVVTGLDEPHLSAVPASTQVALYRVAQEALTNALRYGGTIDVSVALRIVPGGLRLSVEHGPASGTRPVLAPGSGMGIPGMRERMGAVGGTLDAGRTAAGGFAVVATVPVETPIETLVQPPAGPMGTAG